MKKFKTINEVLAEFSEDYIVDCVNKAEDIYAFPTIEDYEKSSELNVNQAFKIGWNMARIKESQFETWGERVNE